MLAISIMAEIVSAFPARSSSRLPRTAVLLLAAGASSRFTAGDKLLADLGGRPVLQCAAENVPDDPNLFRLAVVPAQAAERRSALSALGWRVVENPDANQGQSTSLRVGIEALTEMASIDQVIILLADMPFVPSSHLDALRQNADVPGASCVMSKCDGVLSPPALFKREHFAALSSLSGDRGAKALFLAIEHGNRTVDLAPQYAADIDVTDDLIRAVESADA